MSTPDVASKLWCFKIVLLDGTSCHVCLLWVQVVLQDDIASAVTAARPFCNTYASIANGGSKDERLRLESPIKCFFRYASPGHERGARDLLTGEAVAIIEVGRRRCGHEADVSTRTATR